MTRGPKPSPRRSAVETWMRFCRLLRMQTSTFEARPSTRLARSPSHANDPHAPQGEQNDASERVSSLQVLVAASVTRIAPSDLEQLLALKNKEYHGPVEYNTSGYG